MHYEQKQIPPGTGNFYWYRRSMVEGRQRSEYVGRRLPAGVESAQIKYQADRAREEIRHSLELEMRVLQAKIDNL